MPWNSAPTPTKKLYSVAASCSNFISASGAPRISHYLPRIAKHRSPQPAMEAPQKWEHPLYYLWPLLTPTHLSHISPSNIDWLPAAQLSRNRDCVVLHPPCMAPRKRAGKDNQRFLGSVLVNNIKLWINGYPRHLLYTYTHPRY